MEAPDKIYVNPDLDCLWTDECPGDVEYIRKDTLLKWAETRQECQNLHLEYDAGVYDCLQCLIDKLNSM